MAETISLHKFLPLVLPHVPECPHSIAAFNLRLAAIEFCERTRCWRHLTNVAITEDGTALAAPSFAAIHLIESATFLDTENSDTVEDAQQTQLTPLQYSDVDEAQFAQTSGSTPKYVTQAEYNTIRVLPFTAGTVALSLFLKPVNGSQMAVGDDGIVADSFDAVPDFMYTMHAEKIACGAIYRLMAQPQKPWSNPQMAAAYAQKFEAALDKHFSASIKGQQRAPRRTRYHDY